MILKTKYSIDDNVIFQTQSSGKPLTGWIHHVKMQVFKVETKGNVRMCNHTIIIYYQIKDTLGRIWIALEEDIKGLRRDLIKL